MEVKLQLVIYKLVGGAVVFRFCNEEDNFMQRYYSLEDIRSKVEDTPGLSMSKFYHQVMNGNITKHPDDRSRKRGIRYSAESVDRFLQGEFNSNGRKRRNKTASHHLSADVLPKNYQVDAADRDDVVGIFFLEGRFEKSQVINPILIGSWLEKNRYLYWVLFDAEDRSRILAVLGVLPLKRDVLQSLLEGRITANDIASEDIFVYRPGQSYDCYIASVSAEKDISITPLLHKIFSFWSDASIQIDKIYAIEPYISSPFTRIESPLVELVTECFFSPIQEEDDKTVWRLQLGRNNPAFPDFIRGYRDTIQEKRGTENMIAVLDKIAPKARLGNLEDHSRLQSRYRSQPGGYLAPHVRFRPAETYEDVMAVIQINNDLFGKSKDISDDEFVRHRLTWLDKNPESIYVLEVRKKIVGFASLLPLSPPVINDVLSNRIRMSQIQSDDIQRFLPGKSVDIFVWTVGVDRDIQGQRKRFFGMYLVLGIWNLFNQWGERGIQIRSVYARSDEVDGINISHELGLHPIPPPPGVEKAIFGLRPMDEQQNPFLIQYQRNLAGYQERHK